MVNNINELGLSKLNKVLLKIFPCATSAKMLEEMDEIINEMSDSMIIHTGTNDITNNINLLNNA